jgi:hypothetical protein
MHRYAPGSQSPFVCLLGLQLHASMRPTSRGPQGAAAGSAAAPRHVACTNTPWSVCFVCLQFKTEPNTGEVVGLFGVFDGEGSRGGGAARSQ